MPQFSLPQEARLNDFKAVKVSKPSKDFKRVRDLPEDFEFPTIEGDMTNRRKTDVLASMISTLESEAYHSLLRDSQMPLDTDSPADDESIEGDEGD